MDVRFGSIVDIEKANRDVRYVPEADVRLQFGSNLLAKKSVVSENNNKPRSMQWQRLIVS